MQRKPRILIAEDEAAIRTGLVDVFVYHGYDVDAAEDGLIAERMASTGRYDLVLLDVMMPGRDGFAVLAHLRAQDREQAVILLTAKSADEDVIQGLALGTLAGAVIAAVRIRARYKLTHGSAAPR